MVSDFFPSCLLYLDEFFLWGATQPNPLVSSYFYISWARRGRICMNIEDLRPFFSPCAPAWGNFLLFFLRSSPRNTEGLLDVQTKRAGNKNTMMKSKFFFMVFFFLQRKLATSSQFNTVLTTWKILCVPRRRTRENHEEIFSCCARVVKKKFTDL